MPTDGLQSEGRNVKTALIQHTADILPLLEQHVGKLAEMASAEAGVQNFPPILRANDRSFLPLCGFGRVAYAIREGRSTLWATVVHCDEVVGELIRVASYNTSVHQEARIADSLVNAVIPAIDREIIEEHAVLRLEGMAPRGRPKSSRNIAIDRVAKLLNRSPDAVRKAIERYRATPGIPRTSAKTNAIDTLGFRTDPNVIAEATAIHKYVNEIKERLMNARKTTHQLTTSGLRFPVHALHRFELDLSALADHLSSFVPRTICPWCKGLPQYSKACAPCRGCGWIGKMEGVPDELLDKERPRVFVGGIWHDLDPDTAVSKA
jgi:hypothetical protein